MIHLRVPPGEKVEFVSQTERRAEALEPSRLKVYGPYVAFWGTAAVAAIAIPKIVFGALALLFVAALTEQIVAVLMAGLIYATVAWMVGGVFAAPLGALTISDVSLVVFAWLLVLGANGILGEAFERRTSLRP